MDINGNKNTIIYYKEFDNDLYHVVISSVALIYEVGVLLISLIYWATSSISIIFIWLVTLYILHYF